MSLTLLEIIALTGIFTLAGTVKGAIGLGFADGVDGAAQPDDAAGAGRRAAAVTFTGHQSVAVAVRAAAGERCAAGSGR